MEPVDEFTYKLTRTVDENGAIAPIAISCEDEGAFSADLAAAISDTDAFQRSDLTAAYDEAADTIIITGFPKQSAELDMNAVLIAAMEAMDAYAAEAAEVHSHCVCGKSECSQHDGDLPWTAWDSTGSLPKEGGNYYLVNDVTLDTTCVYWSGTVFADNQEGW